MSHSHWQLRRPFQNPCVRRSTKDLWPFSRYLKYLTSPEADGNNVHATIQQQEMDRFKALERDIRVPQFPQPLVLTNINMWMAPQVQSSVPRRAPISVLCRQISALCQGYRRRCCHCPHARSVALPIEPQTMLSNRPPHSAHDRCGE